MRTDLLVTASAVLLFGCSDNAGPHDSGLYGSGDPNYASGDTTGGDTSETDDDASTCCVDFTFSGGAAMKFCEGPSVYGGPTTAAPSIGAVDVVANNTAMVISAGLSRSQAQTNALAVSAYHATPGAGTYQYPQVDYYNAAGDWHQNNASNGAITVDAWSAVGAMVTGTFEGQVVNMNGTGSDLQTISGTFCAIRSSDR
ncbi:MAG: hypothetical protein A2289_20990 [Deltaproteobacteria bacterium RIFOXYA12_FULL_58_15]|nr:MAG: hypothetical protein A2289_20990 [Deltaproteobacteria bacterium RIFOXYA12_FULL_58_15]